MTGAAVIAHMKQERAEDLCMYESPKSCIPWK